MDKGFFSPFFVLDVGGVDFIGDKILGFFISDFTNHSVYVAFI